MSLSSFSAEDKERAGLVHQPKVRDWRTAGLIERPDHHLKQFRGEEVEKIRWSIGELAEMLKVETSCIRFWEEVFQTYVRKNSKGQRQYSKEDVALYTEIHRLVKVERYTIEGALMKMKRTGKTEV